MGIERKHIQFGFWYHKNWNPQYLTFDDNRIYQVKELGIGFHNEDKKSKEIAEWNRRLESLENVEFIWTQHKLNQGTFETICRMNNLKGINVKWSSIKDLNCLSNQKNLRHLNIGLSSSVESLHPISSLSQLLTFDSENLSKVNDWDSLSNLIQLQGLGLSGRMYKRLKLPSLGFIQGLKKLKYLFLTSTKILDGSLESLKGLKELECLRLTNDWTVQELSVLKKFLPNLEYGNVANDKHSQALNRIFKKK